MYSVAMLSASMYLGCNAAPTLHDNVGNPQDTLQPQEDLRTHLKILTKELKRPFPDRKQKRETLVNAKPINIIEINKYLIEYKKVLVTYK